MTERALDLWLARKSLQTPSRRGLDSNLYGAFPVKWCFSVYCQFVVRSGKWPFFIPSPAIRFRERAQWGQGTETLAKLGAVCLAALVFGSALTPEHAEGR